jgi:hypothetical protein
MNTNPEYESIDAAVQFEEGGELGCAANSTTKMRLPHPFDYAQGRLFRPLLAKGSMCFAPEINEKSEDCFSTTGA